MQLPFHPVSTEKGPACWSTKVTPMAPSSLLFCACACLFCYQLVRPDLRNSFHCHLMCGTGDTGALIALIGGTTDPELQAVLLGHLLQAPADALEAVSYDADVLAGLNAWLQALLDEQRTFHIVELILQASIC